MTKSTNKQECPLRVIKTKAGDPLRLCAWQFCTHTLEPDEDICPCHQSTNLEDGRNFETEVCTIETASKLADNAFDHSTEFTKKAVINLASKTGVWFLITGLWLLALTLLILSK